MGIGDGDWGLGIGDWAQSPIPNPQSPIPNPQSPYIFLIKFIIYICIQKIIIKEKIKYIKNYIYKKRFFKEGCARNNLGALLGILLI